ncbi:hypothetical protein [Marinimicrobium alkaliphilum]|uniref:hypothetical protein n=1 Tax=Marinimicrobium alkaliphilum TaxID=2202654 RepID=UPI000DBA00E9|nr:hypothetical protein [Marinimicrobium alkaliphilum]
MVPSENMFTKTSGDGGSRRIKQARQKAYEREGKFTYWTMYLSIFLVSAATLGVLAGVTISIFNGSASGVAVAVIVGATMAAFSFSTRIERWLLRKYIAK